MTMNIYSIRALLETSDLEKKVTRDIFNNVTGGLQKDLNDAAKNFNPMKDVANMAGAAATKAIESTMASLPVSGGQKAGIDRISELRSRGKEIVARINADISDPAVVGRGLAEMADLVIKMVASDKAVGGKILSSDVINELGSLVKSKWFSGVDDDCRDDLKLAIGLAAQGNSKAEIKSKMHPGFAAHMWSTASGGGGVFSAVIARLHTAVSEVNTRVAAAALFDLFSLLKVSAPTSADVSAVRTALSESGLAEVVLSNFTPTSFFSSWVDGAVGTKYELSLSVMVPMAYAKLRDRSGFTQVSADKYVSRGGRNYIISQIKQASPVSGPQSNPDQLNRDIDVSASLNKFKGPNGGIDYPKLIWYVDHNWLNPGRMQMCYDLLSMAYSDASLNDVPAKAMYRDKWNLRWYLVGQLWSIASKIGLPEAAQWQKIHDELRINPR